MWDKTRDITLLLASVGSAKIRTNTTYLRLSSCLPVCPVACHNAHVPERNKHYGLTTLLDQPLDPKKGLVLQYEVKFSEGHSCGGAYLKLVSHADGFEADKLKDSTPYSIMFGPDRCGPTSKVGAWRCWGD
eukprot:jgi/Chrzof1/1889/Cz10g25030.t1